MSLFLTQVTHDSRPLGYKNKHTLYTLRNSDGWPIKPMFFLDCMQPNHNFVAFGQFLGLLHRFQHHETDSFSWKNRCMWIAAVAYWQVDSVHCCSHVTTHQAVTLQLGTGAWAWMQVTTKYSYMLRAAPAVSLLILCTGSVVAAIHMPLSFQRQELLILAAGIWCMQLNGHVKGHLKKNTPQLYSNW